MADIDYTLEKNLLYTALSESLQHRYEKVISESDVSSDYPESFRRKMSFLIGVDIKNPYKKVLSPKKFMVAIIVAALITLAGCAAVFHKEIGSYLEKWFDEYILVQNDDDSEPGADTIDEIYTLTYVPEGYEFMNGTFVSNMYVCSWKNSNGRLLKMIQTVATNKFFADVETGYSFLMENNGIKIYCKTNATTQSYKWHTDKYEFELMSQEQLSESEIEKILSGIELKE